MIVPGDAALLRIFIGYDDTFGDKCLYDAIVLKARAMGLAGATVSRGLLAYGPASSADHCPLKISDDRPVIIEIVDSEAKIQAFMPVVDEMIESGLMIVEKVAVARCGRKAKTA